MHLTKINNAYRKVFKFAIKTIFFTVKRQKKKAIIVIEKAFYDKINRRKWKQIRSELARIPKEMRVVAMKYKQLKEETEGLQEEWIKLKDI